MSTPGSYGNNKCMDLSADLSAEKLVELIRVAETSERYEDMCKV